MSLPVFSGSTEHTSSSLRLTDVSIENNAMQELDVLNTESFQSRSKFRPTIVAMQTLAWRWSQYING